MESQNCNTCKYHKGQANPQKGHKIPGEYGKCIRPEGLCKTEGMLIPSDKKRLAELEVLIKDNFLAFYQVGCALAEINQKRLYRETHDTFEDYCSALWDIARRTAYQYIEASAVVENVRRGAQIELLPQNERQARALTKLTPEQQVEAWQKAVETAPEGKITARHVKKTIREIQGKKVEKVVRETKARVDQSQIIDKNFKTAFRAFLDQVEIARNGKYKSTSRLAIIKHLDAVRNLMAQDGYDMPDRRCTVHMSDREKLMEAGFTFYRVNRKQKFIQQNTPHGGWVAYNRHTLLSELDAEFDELMLDPKHLRD